MKQETKATTPIQEDGKHTPGPWEVAIFEMNYGKEIAIKESALKGKDGKWMFADRICTMEGKNEANARLIASAPQLKADNEQLRKANNELLEALKEVIDNAGVSNLQDEYYLHSLTLAKCKTLFEIHSPKQ